MKKRNMFLISLMLVCSIITIVFLLCVLVTEGLLTHYDLWRIVFGSVFGAVIIDKLIK